MPPISEPGSGNHRQGRPVGRGPTNRHAWRYAFAREYLQNGGDLASLADYLGHSDVSVTHQAYAIFRTEELKAKHARLSPVAQLHLEQDSQAEQPEAALVA